MSRAELASIEATNENRVGLLRGLMESAKPAPTDLPNTEFDKSEFLNEHGSRCVWWYVLLCIWKSALW